MDKVHFLFNYRNLNYETGARNALQLLKTDKISTDKFGHSDCFKGCLLFLKQ